MRQDTIKILAEKLIESADLQYSADQSLTLAIHEKATASHESSKVKWKFKPIAEKKSAKWITREKRGAYYLYSDFTCAFCLNRFEYTELTIDHVVTRETTEQTLQFLRVTSSPTLRAKAKTIKKAKHATGNLVTCCNACNLERKTLDFESWLFKVTENWLRKGTKDGKISKAAINRAKRTLSMVREQLQLRDRELKHYKELYKQAFLAFEDKKGQYRLINGTKYSIQRDSAFAALFGKGE